MTKVRLEPWDDLEIRPDVRAGGRRARARWDRAPRPTDGPRGPDPPSSRGLSQRHLLLRADGQRPSPTPPAASCPGTASPSVKLGVARLRRLSAIASDARGGARGHVPPERRGRTRRAPECAGWRTKPSCGTCLLRHTVEPWAARRPARTPADDTARAGVPATPHSPLHEICPVRARARARNRSSPSTPRSTSRGFIHCGMVARAEWPRRAGPGGSGRDAHERGRGPRTGRAGRAAPRACAQPASSFERMQSKVWPIILLAVPSISRAPTEASVPAISTSADQSIVVGPSAGPESAMLAVASTADPAPGRGP